MAPSSPPTHDIIPQKSRPQNRSFPESLISLLPAVTYVDPTAPLLNLEVCAAVFGHVSGFVHRADGHAIRSGCQRRHRQLHSQRHNWIARSEEHTSELQSHSFISYAVFCLKKSR